jgi:Bacterial proteasome activator
VVEVTSGERPAGPDQAGPDLIGPATRVVVALGRPVQGPGAPRVESPERVLRIWEMLSGVGDELNLQTMPPETLARIRRLLRTVTAELERSVSPALAEELCHLIGDGDVAEASASAVRIQYAGLLGWLGGLVISMYTQLQDSRRELLMAGHLGGADGPGSRAAGPGRAASDRGHGVGSK